MVQMRSVPQGLTDENMWFPVGGAVWEALEPWKYVTGARYWGLQLCPTSCWPLSASCVWMQMRSAGFLLLPPSSSRLPHRGGFYPSGAVSQTGPSLREATLGLRILSQQHKGKLVRWLRKKKNSSPLWAFLWIWRKKKLILRLSHQKLTYYGESCSFRGTDRASA